MDFDEVIAAICFMSADAPTPVQALRPPLAISLVKMSNVANFESRPPHRRRRDDAVVAAPVQRESMLFAKHRFLTHSDPSHVPASQPR